MHLSSFVATEEILFYISPPHLSFSRVEHSFFRSHDENDESSYHRPISRENNGDQIQENIAPGIAFVLTQKSHYLLIAVATKVNQLRDCIDEESRDDCY
jgi:hypothetical protein